MARPYKRKGSRFYWIAPWIEGRQVPQSSGETDFDRADRKLKILEGKIAANAPITARIDRDSFAALLELVRTDYKVKERASLYDLEKRIDKALVPILGHLPAGKAWLELDNYVLERRAAGVSNATINREFAIVRRAYNLGERKGLVSHVPHIEMLPEAPTAEGFYTRQQFAAILATAPALVRNIMTVAYVTGWRMRSIFRLEWRQVDFDEGFVWLNAGDTKNKKATRWPLDTMELRAVFEEQKATIPAGRIIPFVFHRNGKPIKDIRKTLERVLARAEVSHRFHDLRGTAIVNLLEAGLDSPTIMNMVGLKTDRMIVYYAKKRGMRDDRLREAGKLLEMRMKSQPPKASTT